MEKEIKRLTRDMDKRWLSGVFSGFANYFKIDVIILRILFIMLLFTPLRWILIIGYVASDLLVPPNRHYFRLHFTMLTMLFSIFTFNILFSLEGNLFIIFLSLILLNIFGLVLDIHKYRKGKEVEKNQDKETVLKETELKLKEELKKELMEELKTELKQKEEEKS